MVRSFAFPLALVVALVANYLAPAAQSPARADTGAIDVKTSRVYILVDKSGLGHQHGIAGHLQGGRLKLDAKSGAGQIVFDMPSFIADTDEARKFVGLGDSASASHQKQVTDNMLGPEVLDVKKYPTATFDIESALPVGKPTAAGRVYELRGTFRLHGASQPLVIQAEASDAGAAVHVRGKFAIEQTKFGIKPYTAALGAVGVADKLTIWGEIDLAK